MALVKDFRVETGNPNEIDLNWKMPLGFNNTDDEVIITRTSTHFPVELFNSSFPNKATDSRPIEIFRASTIAVTDDSGVSVSSNTLTDTNASFSLSPSLKGRLVRDSDSQVFTIISNTATSLTLSGSPTSGKYIVLPDFDSTVRAQENYELDIRTSAAPGQISDLVIASGGSLEVKTFTPGELSNLIFMDGDGNKFLIKYNDETTIFLFETSTPVIGNGMAVLNSFVGGNPSPLTDNFKTQAEADSREGTGLLDNQFYYYTAFTKEANTNVARAEFGSIDSGVSTQGSAISTKDNNFGEILFGEYWPSLYRELDDTGDLEDLMSVFGFQLNQLHALVDTYNLQDPQKVFVNALLPLSEQTGLPAIGYTIGADTLRRVAKDMISCWKLKGSKEGIALFIKKLTTWDITDGTADYSEAIQDFLPNVSALRFFDTNLGSTNVRLTQSEPIFTAGGRFVRGLPGVVIPGFFTFREYVITIPNVALYTGATDTFSTSTNTTTITDTSANFGANNSLVGNFLLPNQEEVNDIFEITSNTDTTITVRGIITNRNAGGDYAVLSPLNTNRFIILNKLLPIYQPFGTLAGYQFT